MSLQLSSMTIEEKLKTMEQLWEDLSINASDRLSPAWHKDVLEAREQAISSGVESALEWDEAKDKIRKSVR